MSVYARACVTFARQETHIDRVKKNLPPEGSVRAIFVTRAQWERSFVLHGSPAAEVAAEQGLTEQTLSDETIRGALQRLQVGWKRAKHWISSPDPQYALKKSGVTG